MYQSTIYSIGHGIKKIEDFIAELKFFNIQFLYDLIKEKDFFKEGLEKLRTAHEKQIKLAIMCSESRPEECHRSKLIGQELLKKKISLQHIVSDKLEKSQEMVMAELSKGKGTLDLFGEEMEFRSGKFYD